MSCEIRREARSLNPNRRSHRNKFANKCDESLDTCPLETEINNVEEARFRTKIEKIDRDMTNVLQIARRKAECGNIGILGKPKKTRLWGKLQYYKLLMMWSDGKDITYHKLE